MVTDQSSPGKIPLWRDERALKAAAQIAMIPKTPVQTQNPRRWSV